MREAAAGVKRRAEAGAPGHGLWTAFLAMLALLWLQFFYAMAPSWTGATYYDYAWLVPPFTLLFLWRRWQDLDVVVARPSERLWPWALVACGVATLLPLRLIEHVDVFWRLALWVHAAIVLGVSHLAAGLLFGWRVSFLLLPASLFALLAIPLPTFLERELVQGLTQQVVNLASGALPLAGYPIDVAGNSLVVKGELMDVAEGCSGIRSFQSSAMAGLCLGELLRLNVVKRIVLVLMSLGLAIVCNSGRIFVLARITYDESMEASDAAHDSVGFWVLVFTYGGISLVAWLLTRARKRKVVRSVTSEHG